MKGSFVRRALSGASALTLALGGALVLAGGPAQAATCSHGLIETLYADGGVSHASLSLSWGCSDGKVHWSGTLYDDKCDAMAGRIAFIGGFVDGQGSDWEWAANAGNGCGTHSTFGGSKPTPLDHGLQVDIYAENTFGHSQETPYNYTV